MLGHVSIRVSNLEESVNFYLQALAPLGFEVMRFPTVVGLGPSEKLQSAPIPCFWLREHTPGPQNNYSPKPTPIHVSFYTTVRQKVVDFHQLGLAAGGKDNGKPGVRDFFPDYYAAYLLDLDGNNIEVVCFTP